MGRFSVDDATATAKESSHLMESVSVEELLLEQFESMPPRLQAAARFVLDHPADVALMSMRELARKINVSHTTMARLVTWLGLNSYDDLRVRCIHALRAADTDGSGRIERLGLQKGAGGSLLVRRISETIAAQVTRIADSEGVKQLGAAAEIIAGSRHIFCLGLRAAHPIARHFAYALSPLREVTLLDMGAGMGLDTLRHASSDDALLVIGFQPYTRATIEIAKQAEAKGTKVIAITHSRASPLARVANESILMAAKPPVSFQSAAPALVAVEILVALIADRTGANIEHVRKQTEQQLAELDIFWRPFPAERRGSTTAAA